MALLYIDGFDHYGTLSSKGWAQEQSSLPTISTTKFRSGTRSVYWMADGYYLGRALSPADETCYLGCALYFSEWPTATRQLFSVGDGSVEHITVAVTAQGEVVLRRGTSTTLATSSSKALITLNRWQYWELKVTVDDAAGIAKVWIDDTEVVDYSGDTRNGGIDGWTTVRIEAAEDGMYMDDLYILDGSGATNNSRLGDSTVWTVTPSTGNGAETDWTPSTGVDHGALVDEIPPSMSDYVGSSTLDHEETFVVPDSVPTGATVFGVQTSLYLQKDGAGTVEVAPLARIGGTNYPGTGVAVSATASYSVEMAEVSPATAVAWTDVEVNGAEFGAKVTSA